MTPEELNEIKEQMSRIKSGYTTCNTDQLNFWCGYLLGSCERLVSYVEQRQLSPFLRSNRPIKRR